MNNFYTKDVVPEEFKNCIGEYTYGKPEISGHGSQYLSIGKYCSIAGDVKILLGGGHDYNRFSSYPFDAIQEENGQMVWYVQQKKTDEPTMADRIGVYIGNDVWIGCRATILPGVQIGSGAVIGAGSVVARHVFPYEIVVGNPIKTIGYRFSLEQRLALQKIAWWDWDKEKLDKALLIYREDIDTFIKTYEKN